MARARQLEDKLGEVINELAQTTEKNFDLQRRLDRSQQQGESDFTFYFWKALSCYF